MSAKSAGESLENARKLYSIYARTAQYFGECFLYNSNSIGSLVFAKARLVREDPLTSHPCRTDMGGFCTRQEVRPQFW